MVTIGHRAVVLVDEGHDLVAEVGQIVAGPRRVEELTSPERGPAVDPDDDDGRGLLASEQVVGELREVATER